MAQTIQQFDEQFIMGLLDTENGELEQYILKVNFPTETFTNTLYGMESMYIHYLESMEGNEDYIENFNSSDFIVVEINNQEDLDEVTKFKYADQYQDFLE